MYPKISGLSLNEIYAYNNKRSLRGNTVGCGGKTHWTDSQNRHTTALNGRELYRLQFSLQIWAKIKFAQQHLAQLPKTKF
jgi:hypothetical protein